MKKKNTPEQEHGISESGSDANEKGTETNRTDDESSKNSPAVPATKSIPIGTPVSAEEFKRLKKKAEEKKESPDNNNNN